MEYRNRLFRPHEVVLLDGAMFVNCRFERCKLVYRGGPPPHITGCTGDSPYIEFDEAAAQTANFINNMPGYGFSDALRDIFPNLTAPPEKPLEIIRSKSNLPPDDPEAGEQVQRWPPAGRCIYCGATDGPLTEEHIVPEGLRSNTRLPDASCTCCQKIINSQIENKFMNEMLGDFRIKFGYSRSKKGQKTLGLTVVDNDGTAQRVETSVEDHPGSFILLDLPPATLIDESGIAREGDPPVLRYSFSKKFPPERLLTKEVEAKRFRRDVFERQIAKIAHAYAVALLGTDAFVPLLPPLILGKAHADGSLVGGNYQFPPVGPLPYNNPGYQLSLFKMGTSNGRYFLIVSVQLLARLGTPVFHAVVSELDPSSPILTAPKVANTWSL